MTFEKYLIVQDSLKNIVRNGETIGFELKVNLDYYHGIFLSLLNGFEITVNGDIYTNKDMTFTVHDNTYEIEELQFVRNDRWEFTEPATLMVKKTGGLNKGTHTIEVMEELNISYFPIPVRSRNRKVLEIS